ncbi:hypothetical protein [Spiroplasma sp. SV19]|uniref:hypothetical protein n=1 Tax=Spiroplasma sp. SV19 TaxID=2570468 RepID=UPI0024B64BCE|nr:hypothetical protein [Spiroplasma sp. SV19]WHQ36647.1 hypothetical protein E7Y35_01775 [Spiroplasma sp. SV19]
MKQQNNGFETIMVITITVMLATLAFVFRLLSVLSLNYITFDYLLLTSWAIYFRWYLNYIICNVYAFLICLYYAGFGFIFVFFTFFTWNLIVTIIFFMRRCLIKYYFLYPILVFLLIYLQYFIAIFLYNWVIFGNISQAIGVWIFWLINNTISAITSTALTTAVLVPFIKMIYYFANKYPFLFNRGFLNYLDETGYNFQIKLPKKNTDKTSV